MSSTNSQMSHAEWAEGLAAEAASLIERMDVLSGEISYLGSVGFAPHDMAQVSLDLNDIGSDIRSALEMLDDEPIDLHPTTGNDHSRVRRFVDVAKSHIELATLGYDRALASMRVLRVSA